jgi:hypothetical protein
MKYLNSIYQTDPITMQREFRHLVMTNIRRIAHSPREAERIMRLFHMQVILVCVAHAALKWWTAGRKDRRDPGKGMMPVEMPATIACEECKSRNELVTIICIDRGDHEKTGPVLTGPQVWASGSSVCPVLWLNEERINAGCIP